MSHTYDANWSMKWLELDGGRSKYYKRAKMGDCVIRSISLALGQDYKQTFEELCEWAIKLGDLPNTQYVYERYLKHKGWSKQPAQRTREGRLQEVVDYRGPRCLMHTRSHLTYINSEGNLEDTWDARWSKMGVYWTCDRD